MSIDLGIRPAEILLVEDNPSDVRLTIEAMREGEIITNLSVVADGEEALDYLFKRGKFEDASRPDLILLDLNLPRRDGREVLGVIKAQEELMRIPVVVLSTSASDDDIQRSYELHANCYISKPGDLDGFIDVIKQIEAFWLRVVRLPDREGL